jgi:acyl-CoA thioester hydrolase
MSEIIHETTVPGDWIDYNGHLTEAGYVLVFGHATDGVLDRIGMDDAFRTSRKVSAYTVEGHINYYRESREGDALRVRTFVVGTDAKRMHLLHRMYRVRDGREAHLASSEVLLLHVDTSESPRTAPFAPEVAQELDRLRQAHVGKWDETEISRRIALGG